MVIGCSSQAYTPRLPIPEVPEDEGGGGGGGGGGGSEEWGEENMTVYFYLDYSHSDEPITTLRWWALRPIGLENIPEVAKVENLVAADELYPNCLGYSEYPSAVDSSLLWNFETDYKQSNTLNLYGIWVSES